MIAAYHYSWANGGGWEEGVAICGSWKKERDTPKEMHLYVNNAPDPSPLQLDNLLPILASSNLLVDPRLKSLCGMRPTPC